MRGEMWSREFFSAKSMCVVGDVFECMNTGVLIPKSSRVSLIYIEVVTASCEEWGECDPDMYWLWPLAAQILGTFGESEPPSSDLRSGLNRLINSVFSMRYRYLFDMDMSPRIL